MARSEAGMSGVGPLQLRGGSAATETLTGTRVLTRGDPNLISLDPGGAGRDVTLPAEAGSDGFVFWIANHADAAEDLTVKSDGGATIGTVSQNEVGIYICDGTTWTVFFVITGTIS